MLITSPANQHLRRARGVRDGKEPELIFVEGERLCEECVHSGLELVACFYSPSPTPRAQEIIAEVHRRECPLYEVVDVALDAISDTVNSQGIIILATRPAHSLHRVIAAGGESGGLIICLDAVQDPGNFGTIVRTAEAAGAGGVVALRGSVDAYAPKTLRSAMGSAFRLPIATDVSPEKLLSKAHDTGLKVVAAAMEAEVTYTN